MMSKVRLLSSDKINGREIQLPTSKSISNRVLIIQALLKNSFQIHSLSDAEDTQKLNEILQSLPEKINSGDGGTTFRFLLPLLCTLHRNFELSGTAQLNSRPIEHLVEAINQLGGDVRYINQAGQPPLNILPSDFTGGEIIMNTSISSQFISALMLVAPVLKKGLLLNFVGDPVSTSYIEMTAKVMRYFHVDVAKEKQSVRIPHQSYFSRDITIEADWSAAAFFYEWVALSKSGVSLFLRGLKKSDLQGDEEAEKLFCMLGVETSYTKDGATVTKTASPLPVEVEYNFLNCPDLAQAFITSCVGLKIKGRFTGLRTLKHKETNRLFALQQELKKIGAQIEIDDDSLIIKDVIPSSPTSEFNTYGDHRMAMCLAPLSCIYPKIIINAPDVVSKSFPGFWNEVEKCCVVKYD
jgi:3-phosphoshikimate 1-carboxyvinyltransferase